MFTKLWKATISFVMSVGLLVCACGTTRLPLDRFSWNLISEYYLKICHKNSYFITIWQENLVLYTKTNTYFVLYLVQFFSEWEIFHTKVVQKIESTFYVWLFVEKHVIYEIMWWNVAQPDRPQITWCMLDTLGYKHTLRIFNTSYFSAATMVALTCLNVTLYVYWLFC